MSLAVTWISQPRSQLRKYPSLCSPRFEQNSQTKSTKVSPSMESISVHPWASKHSNIFRLSFPISLRSMACSSSRPRVLKSLTYSCSALQSQNLRVSKQVESCVVQVEVNLEVKLSSATSTSSSCWLSCSSGTTSVSTQHRVVPARDEVSASLVPRLFCPWVRAIVLLQRK